VSEDWRRTGLVQKTCLKWELIPRQLYVSSEFLSRPMDFRHLHDVPTIPDSPAVSTI